MRITSGEDLLAACEGCATWRGRAVGLVEGAPDDASVWLRVYTVDEAEKLVNGAMFAAGAEYTPSLGLAALIANGVEVDEDDWTQEECRSERLRPLFANAADVLDYGDPALPGGRANVLLQAVMMAGGLRDVQPMEQAGTPGDFRARAAGGRWVTLSPLADGPEAWVAKLTERHLTLAAMESDREALVKHPAVNQVRHARSVCSHVLLDGPRGAPLLTMDEIGALPYGLAAYVEYVATDLGMGQGREPRVATFRLGQPVVDGAGEPAAPDLVVRGEAGATAG